MKKVIIFLLSIIYVHTYGQTLLPVPSTPTTANINAALGGAIAASGTNTYTATLTGLTTYTGFAADIQFTNKNTSTSCSLNINGLGAKSLKKYTTSLANLDTADIKAGSRIRFYYNGTYLVMMGGAGGSSLTGGDAITVTGNTINLNGTTTHDIEIDCDTQGNHDVLIGNNVPFGSVGFSLSNVAGSATATALYSYTGFNFSMSDGTALQASSAHADVATAGPLNITSQEWVVNGDAGTSGYFLKSLGAGSPPVWAAASGGGSSGWAVTGSTTLTGAATIVGSNTNIINFKFDAIGSAVPASGVGLNLVNSTAALVGAPQQNSPAITFEGQSYCDTSTNQSIKIKQYILTTKSGNRIATGKFLTHAFLNGGTGYDVLSTDINTGKTIMSGDIRFDQPPMLEFVRHFSSAEIGRGSIGYLGSTEMNLSVNMDYTTGSHRYYDSTKSAMWQFWGNSTNSFGVQWTKAGHINDNTMWTTYGKVVWDVDIMPNGSGEAVQYGSVMHAQQLDLIDDNYTTANALLKLHNQAFSITGPDQMILPRSQIGSRGISGNQVLTLQYPSHETLIEIANEDNNSNSSHFEFLKNKAGSYNLSAGTKIGWSNFNTLAEYGARSSGSIVVGSFTGVEHYWNTTNAAGVQADRMVLGQEGNLQVTGGMSLGYIGKTANYTLTASDYLVNCTSNSFTITLPTAVGIAGRMYIIKNTGTATIITITTASSQTIDGSAPSTITTLTPLRIMSDGSNWITF